MAYDFVSADAVQKIDAGAMLVYALYHSSTDLITGLPDSVLKAYGQACEAYGISPARRVEQADALYPVKYLDE